jgi:hypothetical protein
MTVHRYSKDTIKGQVWETTITDHGDKIVLCEIHSRLKTSKVIKEVEKVISRREAEEYKINNSQWLIESY